MRLSQIIVPALVLYSDAFTMPNMGQHRTASSLSMSSTEANSVPIVISGNNIEVTAALNDYVNSKLERTIGKLSSSGVVKDCDVHLTVNKNPKVKASDKAEVVTTVKGTVIRCSEESPDMYASIDAVSDRLARKLLQYKERRLSGFHGGPNMGENLAAVLDSVSESIEDTDVVTEDNFVDPEAPVVTKIKSYDLSAPLSLQEAIFGLDYVDHDFYVFRDAETNEINVVYKRNAGGYGLIQPQ